MTRINDQSSDHPPFVPFAEYIPEGDCIESFYSPETFVGRWVHPGLVLYYGRETGEVVGSLLMRLDEILS